MSADGVSWASEQELPHFEKVILIMLGKIHDKDTNICSLSMHPCYRENATTSERTIYRLLRRLEARGLIRWTRPRRKDRSDRHNYALNFSNVQTWRVAARQQPHQPLPVPRLRRLSA
jgi:hypothetical protein